MGNTRPQRVALDFSRTFVVQLSVLWECDCELLKAKAMAPGTLPTPSGRGRDQRVTEWGLVGGGGQRVLNLEALHGAQMKGYPQHPKASLP